MNLSLLKHIPQGPDMCCITQLWVHLLAQLSSVSSLINREKSAALTAGRESGTEKQKDNKDAGMVVIRQRRPSALSCVYSVSAHDIRAGETNLSPMRRPWPWYHISWSETHQAADTPPFLPGKKDEAITHRHKQGKITNSQPYRNVFHPSSAFFSLSVSASVSVRCKWKKKTGMNARLQSPF